MMREPEPVLARIATTAAGLFAGASLSISVVHHPALLQSTASSAFRAAYFQAMYRRAAPLQASLATLSGATALVTGLNERKRSIYKTSTTTTATWWLASGTTMLAIVPYTLVIMMKLNRQLLEAKPSVENGDLWIEASLRRWGRLHSFRTGASGLAFVSMVMALSRQSE